MSRTLAYIGYPTLEAWARSVERKLPAYACLVEEPQPPDSHGIQAVLLVIWVGQHRPQAQEIHYFRCRVGLLEYLGKSPLGNDYADRKRRAEEAWALIRSWLCEQGFEVREGVIAPPKELKLFEGFPEFLTYDKERKRYVRADRAV